MKERKRTKKASKKPDRSDTKKKAMLVALEATLGVVSPACKSAGVSRSQHYEWMNTDENYKQQVDDISDVALDFAESKLHARIRSQDTASIIFYLKTKGKKRGYVEKTEQDTNISLMGSVPIRAWLETVIEK